MLFRSNFKLKIVKKDGYWNYDKSEFGSVEPLLDDDDALEALWKKQYSLTAVSAADQFKSYEDLEKRLKYVLGQKGTPRMSSVEEETEYDNYTESVESTVTKELEESYSRSKSPSLPVVNKEVDEDEEDALAYFQRLAEE